MDYPYQIDWINDKKIRYALYVILYTNLYRSTTTRKMEWEIE